MKAFLFLFSTIAAVAVAGCNTKQSDSATSTPVKLEQVAPPKGGDWSMVANPAQSGGFVMGNPNAKVKLVEIGSLTCPHCRAFDEEGVPTLIDKYVKSGQVSWEFRNYVRDGFDLTAALIARCNGAKTFFPLARALYKDQPEWVGKVQTVPQDKLQAMQNLPPEQQFGALAKVAGLQDWAAARGVPLAKSAQCLANQQSINQLVQMASDITSQYPEFQGTPSFIINGKMLKDTATWDKLKPQLEAAVK